MFFLIVSTVIRCKLGYERIDIYDCTCSWLQESVRAGVVHNNKAWRQCDHQAFVRAVHQRSSVESKSLLRGDAIAYGKITTAFCATTGKNLAAIGSWHSFTEAVLVNALAVRGLKCSFHCLMIVFWYICTIRGAKIVIICWFGKC